MLNMQFNMPVVVSTARMDWEASPMAGVWRKSLAREATEHGHATSLVRYDAGSSFSSHRHPKGEEILVLDGVFSDEHGDYPADSYLRNPPGSSHSPFSKSGCELLVKLDQFDDADVETVRLNTRKGDWLPGEDKLEVMLLHDFGYESVVLLKWPADTQVKPHQYFGGEEFFVISGEIFDEFGSYPAGSWVRNPHKSEHCPYVLNETVIWLKTGHLLS